MVGDAVAPNEIASARGERMNERWRHFGNVPVGRLGIPLDHYGECALAMREARAEREPRAFAVGMANYLRRASEVMRAASHDRYHWLRLQSAVLPAEPEAIAVTAAAAMLSHRWFDHSAADLSERMSLEADRYGRMMLEIGDDLWRASREGNSFDRSRF